MLKNIVFVISLLFISQLAYAHGDGHGPVSERQAIALASKTVSQFAGYDPGLGFGKLVESWRNISPGNKKMHQKGDGYYIVSIANDEQGKTLYVLLSISGEVYDANFTGIFPGLK
ncbi:MAG: DUF6488 family protein [Gammaproteobacteria bacterium]|nr:DUF6488 family protein [Gammaproteobacteria bacterium]